MLRKVGVMRSLNKAMVTYCQYGDNRMKPTDLWHNIDNWAPRPPCRQGAACHDSAPRGTHRGTQDKVDHEIDRSKVPAELCDEILSVIEQSTDNEQKETSKNLQSTRLDVYGDE